MQKFVLLNGPPRSGKDTVAKMILNGLSNDVSNWSLSHEKFSAPLKEAFAAIMEASIYDFVVTDYEEHKEEIIPVLGVSFRQWQIDFSEKFMKPLYGNDIFGKLLLHRIQSTGIDPEDNWLFIISDCGFQIEVDYLLRNIPPQDVLLIHLYRNGCSFANDSREYVRAPNVLTYNMDNNDGLSVLERRIDIIIRNWLL